MKIRLTFNPVENWLLFTNSWVRPLQESWDSFLLLDVCVRSEKMWYHQSRTGLSLLPVMIQRKRLLNCCIQLRLGSILTSSHLCGSRANLETQELKIAVLFAKLVPYSDLLIILLLNKPSEEKMSCIGTKRPNMLHPAFRIVYKLQTDQKGS